MKKDVKLHLDSIWTVFNNFMEIKHKNLDEYDKKCHTLSAAKLAEYSYDDDCKNTSDNRYQQNVIDLGYNIRALKFTRKEDNNVILVFRGTQMSSLKNWYVNFKSNPIMIGAIFFRLVCFILSYNLLYISYEKNIFFDELYQVVFISFLMTVLSSILFHYTVVKSCGVKVAYHSQYSSIIDTFIRKDSSILKYDKILVIGHSLGGGLSESLIYKVNNQILGKARGITFNKSFASFGFNEVKKFREYAMDHRLYYDILSFLTFVFVYPIESMATIKPTILKTFFKKALILSICLLIFSIFLVYGKYNQNIGYLSNVWKVVIIITVYKLGITLINIFLMFTFKNHSMQSFIEALKEKCDRGCIKCS